MENKSNPFLNQSLTAGLYLALIGIILSLLLWMLNYIPTTAGAGILFFIVTLAINFFFLWYFTKKYRDDSLGGYINYGQALLFALAMVLVSAIISAVYQFIFNAYIDPEYTQRVMTITTDNMESRMLERGMSQEQVDLFMARMEDRFTKSLERSALANALRTIPGTLIFGTIVGLITSAVVKKSDETIANN